MDSTLSFFSLPFVDSENTDLVLSIKNVNPDCGFDDLHATLPSHGGLLGPDDVLAQFLSPDEPLEEPDLNGPTTLHCEICRKKFDNAKKYYGHLRIHSKGNAWVCDKCPDQKFATKQHLMKHSLTHKPLERVWRCQHCSLSFEALWRLQQHLFSTHLEYRPHKCDECEKAFHKKSDLKRHKDMHSNLKKFSCSVCGEEFKDKCNLKRHMLRHTNEKPYCCAGCGNRYKQLASMKRHSLKCIKNQHKVDTDPKVRKSHCRVCGMTFQYKSALLEHCVRQHTNAVNPTNNIEKDDKSHIQLTLDHNKTVDNIVDDILSAEDDYMTMSTQNEMLNVYNQNQAEVQDNNENLMHVEFLKAMNQLHSLDDELFYNDLDFDNFQASHIFNMNTNDMDYGDKNAEILFDFADSGRSMDQDIMNVLSEVAPSIPETNKTEPIKNPPVSVNECATIFESDVDLEASTNLAANLNQLIGENSVHYVSTEDDDTFIISLNSAIDAEQLTDMLNIGVESIENNNEEEKTPEVTKETIGADNGNWRIDDPIVLKIEEPVINKDVSIDKENAVVKPKIKKCILFIRTCNKLFKNLAANLNQLIGENSVHYGSTEDDDTFIISFNSAIDAEQLTDMLNIGVESIENNNEEEKTPEVTKETIGADNGDWRIDDPIVLKIEEPVINKDVSIDKENAVVKPKIKKCTLFICRTCNKVFKKKDNYKSHKATHNPSLRTHRCRSCGLRFSYRSTLNKHLRAHAPRAPPSHRCVHAACDKAYDAAWKLKHHVERDHEKLMPFTCDQEECGKRFYKLDDLHKHQRLHTGERPYSCDICGRAFLQISHLKRHVRMVDCTKHVQ